MRRHQTTSDKRPDQIFLSGGRWSYGYRGMPEITLADLLAAIDAYGGNQTVFAREIMQCKDGRQVRRWLAGGGMSYEYAKRLRAHIDAGAGTLNMFPKGTRRAK